MSETSETAVVVGATGAMGSVVTHRLVDRGLRVVAVARTGAALDALAGEHGSDRIVPCVADIGDDSAIELIRSTLSGRVKLALFAAGLPVRGSADTIEPEALVAGANVKLAGLVRLLHAVRDRLGAGSRFVAVAGTLGLEPRAHEAGPGAINAGVFNLMRQISLLYGPRGVTVHTIAPGPTDTPRLRQIVARVAEERGVDVDEVWKEYEAQTSLGRMPTVNEIAWAVTLLLEPEADILHGSVLHLDAGGLRGIG
jgi:NAD(P)-dependent dehydrogenase (short-subunit alcohol dehydrogenase family)